MRLVLNIFFIASTFVASSLSSSLINNRPIDEELRYRIKRAIPKENSKEGSGPTCYGYSGQKGRCLPLENCFLQPLKENYIKYKAYYCILDNEVGVCCPNAIAIPERYSENLFQPPTRRDSTGRRRSSRAVTDEMSHDSLGSEIPDEPCRGHAGKIGKCLPFEQCNKKVPIEYDYIKYKGSYCTYNEGSLIGICCPEESSQSIEDLNDEDSEKDLKMKSKFPKKFSSKVKKHDRNDKIRERRDVGDEEQICGRNGRLLSQVLKNQNQQVENKAWPWAVTIINADTKEHHCGGTLVSRYHILSAAHCFYYGGALVLKERILARLGEYDFKKQDDSRFNDYEIDQLIMHADYDDPIHLHDIALLVLKRPARYNVYVQPACMPSVGDIYDNITAVVVGWGKLDFGGKSSSVLREVHVPVWEHAQCVNSYTQTIFTTNVCAAAYDGGKDACQGDSGGPLMAQRDDGRWKIIGIVSWGVQCALKGKPGIYTQVNKYLDWMTEVTSG